MTIIGVIRNRSRIIWYKKGLILVEHLLRASYYTKQEAPVIYQPNTNKFAKNGKLSNDIKKQNEVMRCAL